MITDRDGGNRYYLPQHNPDESYSVTARTRLTEIPADGMLDQDGDRRSLRSIGRAEMAFSLASCRDEFDSRVQALLAALDGPSRDQGLRKLWRWDYLTGAGRRFAYARPVGRPALSRELFPQTRIQFSMLLPDPAFYQPLTQRDLTLAGHTAEQIAEAEVGEPIAPHLWFARFDITSSPYNFTLTNSGDLETRMVVLRLASQASNGFTNPSIVNETSGHQIDSTDDGGTNQTVLSINAHMGRARLSTDNGASWTAATNNLTLPSTQAEAMLLLPGANDFEITSGGTPNYRLYAWWLPAYRD